MTASYGFATQCGIDSASPVTHRLDFQTETLRLREEFVYTGGLRGTRSREATQTRAGKQTIAGQLTLHPNSAEMALLLPWILGTAAAGTLYALADTVPSRYVTFDRVAKVYTYASTRVTRAVFSGVEHMPLVLTLDLVASTETEANAGTFPSLSLDVANGPFMFTDLVLTIASGAYSCKDFTLTVDNMIDANRYFNSVTLSTAANAMDRIITLSTHLPHGDATAVYNTGIAGVSANATFTNGAAILNFDFAKVKFPRESPETQGRSEILLPLTGQCLKSGATLELVTNLTV